MDTDRFQYLPLGLTGHVQCTFDANPLPYEVSWTSPGWAGNETAVDGRTRALVDGRNFRLEIQNVWRYY